MVLTKEDEKLKRELYQEVQKITKIEEELNALLKEVNDLKSLSDLGEMDPIKDALLFNSKNYKKTLERCIKTSGTFHKKISKIFNSTGQNKRSLDTFIQKAEQPGGWIQKAVALKGAADIIQTENRKKREEFLKEMGKLTEEKDLEEINCKILGTLGFMEIRLYWMYTIGIVIEDFAKALLLERDIVYADWTNKHKKIIYKEKETDTEPEGLRQHKLKNMLDLIPFELDEEEQFLINIIQEPLNWKGRYPIPFSPENYNNELYWHPGLEDIFEGLYKRLFEESGFTEDIFTG